MEPQYVLKLGMRLTDKLQVAELVTRILLAGVAIGSLIAFHGGYGYNQTAVSLLTVIALTLLMSERAE